MEEPYIEGVTIHGDPESCVGAREGAGEALTGVHVGRAIEPRNADPGCRRCRRSGRQHRQQRYRKLLEGPARSENPSMYGTSMCENREARRSPVSSR